MSLKLRISRIDALGREGQQKIRIDLESGFVKNRQQHFVSRAWIGG